MCLQSLHDKVKNLGLGAMYERHWGLGGFRDLFDDGSADWPSTALAEKVIALRAFESAGVTVAEIIGHYRQTLGRQAGGDQALARLPATLRAYRTAGYAPPLPADVEAAVGGSTAALR
jgi:hypothetical protein